MREAELDGARHRYEDWRLQHLRGAVVVVCIGKLVLWLVLRFVLESVFSSLVLLAKPFRHIR